MGNRKLTLIEQLRQIQEKEESILNELEDIILEEIDENNENEDI
jgi:hypothetical protein